MYCKHAAFESGLVSIFWHLSIVYRTRPLFLFLLFHLLQDFSFSPCSDIFICFIVPCKEKVIILSSGIYKLICL